MQDTSGIIVTTDLTELTAALVLEPGQYLLENSSLDAKVIRLARLSAPPADVPAYFHQIQPGGRLRLPVAAGDRLWVWMAMPAGFGMRGGPRPSGVPLAVTKWSSA